MSIRAHGNNGNLPQRRFFDVVERAFDFLTIHLAAAFDLLALFHIRTDAQLPVRSCLALRDDIGRILAVGDDLPGDFQHIVPNCGRNESDPAVRLVLVIGQKRDAFGDLHSGKIDHNRMLPPRQIHFSAGVGNSDHFRFRAV